MRSAAGMLFPFVGTGAARWQSGAAPTTPSTTPAAATAAPTAATAAPTAATATPAAAAAAASPKKKQNATDFSKVLGSRLWAVHPAGPHMSVYVDSNTFGWIVMDREGSSANALGESFMQSLGQALDITDKLIAEKKIRIVIIASAKDTFCVGADLEQLYPVTDASIGERASKAGQQMFDRIENSKYPIVAAINGLALGGGCELALACHHRVAADTAAIGLPECLLGLLPGAGGTVRLPKLIGLQNALQWILASGNQKADKAKKQGAVDAVFGGSDRFPGENRFLEGARAWAGKLVDKPLKPSKRKPQSLVNWFINDTPIGHNIVKKKSLEMLDKKTKGKYIGQYKALDSVMFGLTAPKAQALDMEAKLFAGLLVTPEAKNQCALYFLDDGMKKVEKKTGIPKDKIASPKKIGVIGAGVMGSGIVHYFANKGYPVAVKDVTSEAVEKGMTLVKNEFMVAVKKKKLDDKGLEAKMKLVTGGTTDDIFKDCDVIIEAAVEVMDIKKKILTAMEASGVLDGKKLFATNTSSLSLTELQSVSKYPSTIVGMHFFNPVSKMPLVEVIKGKQTSQDAAATIFNLAVKTGKKPIIVGDAPGFLVNRILGVYMSEAGRLAVQDRANPNKIDRLITNFGMPMGPFRLLDEVGLDVATHVGPVLENGLKSSRFTVDGKINDMVKAGMLGKKNNKGFYNYDEKGKETAMNSAVISQFIHPSFNEMFPEDDILDRCVLLMVNEAAMILTEGIAASPEDVDIGMIWGTGFPPFRGGLLQYADHRGASAICDRLCKLRDVTRSDRFEPCAMLKDLAKNKARFFPNRPFVPYVERK
jgi:3-hydroxyacyl-CoA dehydrogenase/enoyl-CoA hydratase/3-hydroxybutyryl-CoA epimerase